MALAWGSEVVTAIWGGCYAYVIAVEVSALERYPPGISNNYIHVAPQNNVTQMLQQKVKCCQNIKSNQNLFELYI